MGKLGSLYTYVELLRNIYSWYGRAWAVCTFCNWLLITTSCWLIDLCVLKKDQLGVVPSERSFNKVPIIAGLTFCVNKHLKMFSSNNLVKILNKHLKMFSSNSLVKNKSFFFLFSLSLFLWGGVGVAYFTMWGHFGLSPYVRYLWNRAYCCRLSSARCFFSFLSSESVGMLSETMWHKFIIKTKNVRNWILMSC